jgi:hypothetical protein
VFRHIDIQYYYQTNTAIAKNRERAENPMDPMAIISNPAYIKILVAGGRELSWALFLQRQSVGRVG